MATPVPPPDGVHILRDPARSRRIRRLLEERGLTSFMNDTKWRELCVAVRALPFPPAYQVKLVDAEEPNPPALEPVSSYFGDWATTPEASVGLHIEWMKIAPRFRGRIDPRGPVVERDCSNDLRALFERLRLRFREPAGFFVLYGHAAAGEAEI